jgi:GNAT superfamily N-acetyltransferase
VEAVQIHPVDLDDDVAMAQLWAVEAASKRMGRPWADPEDVRAFTLDHRYVDPGEDHELWAAWDGGRVVGLAQLWFPLNDNTDKVWAGVDVHPDDRGRGVGSALVEQCVARAVQRGRAELLGDLLAPLGSTPDHPYRRFAQRHGFSEASLESMRHLALPVPGPRLDELAESARPLWSTHYRLATFVGGVPEPLQKSLCDTENQLAVDAPGGTVEYEPESLDPERYQLHLRLFAQIGRERYTTVALDRDEQVVAYTDLVIGAGTQTMVWQWGTLVRREHRGHRLGLAVKVENLRRLQADRPERGLVITGNADVNAHMLAINEALGFRLAEVCPQLQRRL